MPSKSILGNQENGRAGFIGMATIFCEKNKYLIYMYIQTNGKQQQTYFLMLNTVSYENITNSSFLFFIRLHKHAFLQSISLTGQ